MVGEVRIHSALLSGIHVASSVAGKGEAVRRRQKPVRLGTRLDTALEAEAEAETVRQETELDSADEEPFLGAEAVLEVEPGLVGV